MNNKLYNGKINLVDFFKGVAILMVILVHSVLTFELPENLKNFAFLGQLGCQIFFVLSSFTLCLSMDNKKENWLAFMKKRIKKIVPGYWSMIIIYILLAILSINILQKNVLGTSLKITDILINIFLLNGIVPTAANNLVVRGGWFVGTIIIFYIFTPILYKIFNIKKDKWKKNRIWLFPVLGFVLSLLTQFCLYTIDNRIMCANNNFIYFSFVNQFPSYAIGFSLYALYKESRVDNKNKICSLLIFVIFLIISVLLFYLNFSFSFSIIPFSFSISFAALSYFLFITSRDVDSENIIVKKIINAGKISFCIYLTHPFITYEFAKVVSKVIHKIMNMSDIVIYFALLPFIYIFSYFLGVIFSKYLNLINKLFKKKSNI